MKKGKKSSPKSSPKKGRKRFHDDDDDSDLASVEEKLLPWHYVNPALPLVVEFDELDEQETALLLAMSRWVELGERPANALWAAVRQHGNRPHSYLRYAFGNQEDYDKMRDPRAIFVRCRAAVPHVISANLFARIGLVLLRFCDPSKGDETVNALWEACRTGLPPSPELRSAMELLASMDSAAPSCARVLPRGAHHHGNSDFVSRRIFRAAVSRYAPIYGEEPRFASHRRTSYRLNQG
jgi:hypothetical protein